MILLAVMVSCLALILFYSSTIFHVVQNAKYTIFQYDLPWEDRLTAFYLSLPGVFPYAQPWVNDDEAGRLQIAKDRLKFNSFVNAEHDNQVETKGLQVDTLKVPMRDGENINVFMYHSKSALAYGASNSKPLSPMYVWIHGGGWAYGEGRDSLLLGGVPDCNVSVVDSSTNAKSTINNLVIASIEHRLPPEYKFPTPTDDTFDALVWLIAHAEDFGVDPARISIGGTSAGGNLAAVLGQRAFQANLQLQYQFIMVPVIHYGCSTRSCMKQAFSPLLGAQEIVWFHTMHARNYTDGYNPHYNPIMHGASCAPSATASVAPAMIVTAAKDSLRDDGLDYLSYLRDSCQAHTTHIELPGSHWSVYAQSDLYRSKLADGIC